VDLLQLDYFVKVAENATMLQAAESLNVSPSTLSMSIKKLEGELGTKLFGSLIDDKAVTYCSTDAELQTGLFNIEGGSILHIVNVTGCIPEGRASVSHNDPIPNFTDDAEKLGEFEVTVRAGKEISAAMLYTPEYEGGIELKFTEEEGRVTFTVPGGIFSGYAVIEMTGKE